MQEDPIIDQIREVRHRISEQCGHDVGLAWAVTSYIASVLVHKPDEANVLGVDTLELPVVADPSA